MEQLLLHRVCSGQPVQGVHQWRADPGPQQLPGQPQDVRSQHSSDEQPFKREPAPRGDDGGDGLEQNPGGLRGGGLVQLRGGGGGEGGGLGHRGAQRDGAAGGGGGEAANMLGDHQD